MSVCTATNQAKQDKADEGLHTSYRGHPIDFQIDLRKKSLTKIPEFDKGQDSLGRDADPAVFFGGGAVGDQQFREPLTFEIKLALVRAPLN